MSRWHRNERSWLTESLDAIPKPWPEAAALQWLRLVSDMHALGLPAWSPNGQVRGIPGRPMLLEIFGNEAAYGRKRWTDHRVRALLREKSTLEHDYGDPEEISVWEDPHPYIERRKALEKADRRLGAVQAQAKALAGEQLSAQAAEMARLKERLALLQDQNRQPTASESPADRQDLEAKSPEGQEGTASGPPADRQNVSTHAVETHLVHTVRSTPQSPPPGEPHPPAPALAGESQTENTSPALSSIPGAAELTVKQLAAHGIHTLADWWDRWPALAPKPKRPTQKHRQALDVLISAAGHERPSMTDMADQGRDAWHAGHRDLAIQTFQALALRRQDLDIDFYEQEAQALEWTRRRDLDRDCPGALERLENAQCALASVAWSPDCPPAIVEEAGAALVALGGRMPPGIDLDDYRRDLEHARSRLKPTASIVALPAHVTAGAEAAQALEALEELLLDARSDIQMTGGWTPRPGDRQAAEKLQTAFGDLRQLDDVAAGDCPGLARRLFPKIHPDLLLPPTQDPHDDTPARRQPRPAGADRRSGPKIHGRGASRRRA